MKRLGLVLLISAVGFTLTAKAQDRCQELRSTLEQKERERDGLSEQLVDKAQVAKYRDHLSAVRKAIASGAVISQEAMAFIIRGLKLEESKSYARMTVDERRAFQKRVRPMLESHIEMLVRLDEKKIMGQIDILDGEKAKLRAQLEKLGCSRSGYVENISGSWEIVQGTGPSQYRGMLHIRQSGNAISGRAIWANHEEGVISGSVAISANGLTITFTIRYSGDLVGTYMARIWHGYEMIDGSARSNKGGPSVFWYASKTNK